MTSYALSEAASDDFTDYDVISDPRSLDSSIADLADDDEVEDRSLHVQEIPPSLEAKNAFDTVCLSADDIQAYVRRNVKGGFARSGPTGTVRSRSRDPHERTKAYRIYVDGVFESINVSIMNHLRQAKLSFPSVHLVVGVLSSSEASFPVVERAEVVRHIRWVDEVISDAPLVLDETFLSRHHIDFVAIEEGSSVDPAIPKARLVGYDLMKSLGKAIPTRRTRGSTTTAASTSVPTSHHEMLLKATNPARAEHTDTPEPKEEFC